jgi:acyl-CoA synthetase (AMP-forming)/AMP-acid ligase II
VRSSGVAGGVAVADETVHPGPPEVLTVGALLRDRVERFGSAEVVVTPDRRLTYAELDRTSRALAGQLVAAGAGKGSRVGILCPNGVEWLVTWAAVTRIGALAVLLSTYSTGPELRRTLAHADVSLLVVAPFDGVDHLGLLADAVPHLTKAEAGPLYVADLPALRSIWTWAPTSWSWAGPVGDQPGLGEGGEPLIDALQAAVSPADAAVVIYTSGSTAVPKGVVHTQGVLIRHSARTMARTRAVGPGDRVYAPNPFFWIGGIGATVLGTIHGGATLLCEPRFEPGPTLDFLEREGITVFLGQPHAWEAMRSHPTFADRRLDGLRTVRGGRGLAMTETCSSHAGREPGTAPSPGDRSFGRPIDGIEHRIVDPDTGATVPDGQLGEICVRGEDLMLGMVRRERHEVFDADGWYRTGDLGALVDGEVHFHGRLDDRIRTRGMHVVPSELEAELTALPEIAMAIVAGVPSDAGHDVAAAVVLAAGRSLDVDALRSRLRARLSAYKVPRHISIVEVGDLPLTLTGKVDRRAVAAQLVDRR